MIGIAITYMTAAPIAAQTPLFSTQSPLELFPETGDGPWEVAVADLDGDTDLDLVSANRLSDDVGVWLNTGAGYEPAPGSPFATGTDPRGLAIANVTGDTSLDIVTANRLTDDIRVLVGDGTGSFTPAAAGPSPIGDGAWDLVVVDIDHDGFNDAITANLVDGTISVLLGDGTGAFTPATGSPHTTGTAPEAVAVGNLDGDPDADLDFAVVNRADENVSVFHGDGTGAFTPAAGSPFSVGSSPEGIDVGDVTGDGNLDVVVSNRTANSISVLAGDGSGGYATAAGSPFSVPTAPVDVRLGDMDGINGLDVVSIHNGSIRDRQGPGTQRGRGSGR